MYVPITPRRFAFNAAGSRVTCALLTTMALLSPRPWCWAVLACLAVHIVVATAADTQFYMLIRLDAEVANLRAAVAAREASR